MTEWTSPDPDNPAVAWTDEHGGEHPVAVSGPGLTDQERETLACRCHEALCPLHNDASDGYIEWEPDALFAAVERILAARGVSSVQADDDLRAAWERAVLERCVANMPATGEAPDFLHVVSTAMLDTRAALAASPAPTSVTSVEPGCTCGGMAVCQQCQDRDAASPAPTEDRETCPLGVHGDPCECTARLVAVTRHARESTEQGPDFCRPCSEAVTEWVPWPCAGSLRGVGSDVIERVQALADEWDACDEHGNPLREGSLSEAADELRAALASSTPEEGER